ncbi:snoRNA-binding rRNA-processing protein DIP2 [Ascoidea rubescens DSM 1968]|uniref:Utp12-domain-containing protein n=1 Tax=Ascoidea rubescens DSM 1968 TaxID=1344418 RepID=A0A1D2VEP3_9ASCO|nr:Utp12-domain-containing protein [Ascoidea rubescens DSM 1968]ODV59990.1 Utp12-domain-containing protein [Ascoidea rubescens DSM 1968]
MKNLVPKLIHRNMVKSYQRYEQERCFGVITSNSNVIWQPYADLKAKPSGKIVTAGLEELLIWDIKTGELIRKLNDNINPGAYDSNSSKPPAEITYLQYHAENNIVAAGYSDGNIKIWDLTSGSVIINFSGHKSAITMLIFDKTGTRLCSGSRDSNITLWDLVSESGLFKLRSHKDQITGLCFISPQNTAESNLSTENNDLSLMEEEWLVSTSKDGLIKLWDLKTRQCIETHLAHTGECWALNVNNSNTIAITSGVENNFKIWEINLLNEEHKLIEKAVIKKQTTSKCLNIQFKYISNSLNFFFVQNLDRTLEIYRIRPLDEVNSLLKKKKKKLEEKLKSDQPDSDDENDVQKKIDEKMNALKFSTQYHPVTIIRGSSKIRSSAWGNCTSNSLSLSLSLNNNSIENFKIDLPDSVKKLSITNKDITSSKTSTIELKGHRTDIRAIDISSDNKLLATASNGLLKIWNIKTTNCIRTFDCGYALCCKFLPGGALVVLGTKTGDVELYDLASSELLDSVKAHEAAVWSLDVTPNGKTLVTGSADKMVKFWDFKVEQETISGTDKTIPKLKLFHSKVLELSDDILSVKISPDSKYLAISLLDSTVKVFLFDTLKFYLSLYGHKLPVLSIDISFDSKLIITSSADKNIKIWGLDFGDCHRSLFAHQDSIMSVKFIPNSHNFFSGSKDGLVKYWDGDKFDCIQKLPAHQSEVWSIAISGDGNFVASTSHDHSIRIWRETEDQVFLEEEREKEVDELYEATLLNSLEDDENMKNTGKENEEDFDEVTRAGRQTTETLKAGEKLMEALDMGTKDLEEQSEYNKLYQAWLKNQSLAKPSQPSRNPLLVALGDISSADYVIGVIQKIKPSQLEDSLLVLPFSYTLKLLKFMEIWTSFKHDNYSKLEQNKNYLINNLSLLCRILFFIIANNHKELISQKNENLRSQLITVKSQLRVYLNRSCDELGYNIEGLKFITREWNYKHNTEYIDEYEQREHEDKMARKRVYTTIA